MNKNMSENVVPKRMTTDERMNFVKNWSRGKKIVGTARQPDSRMLL